MVDSRNEKKFKGIQTWPQAIQPKQNSFDAQEFEAIQERIGTFAANLKRQFQRWEGDLLDYMRKKNPKEFYSKFKKPKPREANIHPDTFFYHCKDVASDTSVHDPVELTYNKDTVFEELDSVISKKEILDKIDRLKRDKSHGINLLINEYFIHFKEDMLPFIHKIFNRFLLSGFSHKRGFGVSLFLYLRKGMCLTHIIIEV